MSIITYVPAPGYPANEQGIVNIGGGTSFNVGSALTSGAGVITVDSGVSPQLADALDHFPGLVRQGTTPGPVSNSDVIGPVISHSLRSDKSSPQAGDLLIRSSDGIYAPGIGGGGGGSTGGGGPPVAYQVIAPSGGDDTAALNAAIAAVVVAGKANGSYYGELWFDVTKGPFTVNGAQIKNGAQAFGGTTQGNAQIPLPNIPTTTPKFMLVLRCGKGAPIWDQSRLLVTGTVLVSNIAASYDATYGSPSVIGGPTQEQVGGSYSTNLLLVIDGGLTVITPAGNTAYGVDLQNVAMVKAGSIGINGSLNPAAPPGAAPTSGGAGIRTPAHWGESQSDFERITAMGLSYGIIPGGNTVINDAYVVYCQYGVAPPSAQNRAARFNNLITDACNYHISSSIAGVQTRLDVGTWAVEEGGTGFTTTYHLDDNGNLLFGEANFHNTNTRTGAPIVRGGSGFKIRNLGQPPGHVTSPGVPATTVALQNPFWRDAAVNVTGGTVTVIAVDGTATGLTSGTVIVPSGKSITLTYSVAPAWNWTLL